MSYRLSDEERKVHIVEHLIRLHKGGNTFLINPHHVRHLTGLKDGGCEVVFTTEHVVKCEEPYSLVERLLASFVLW